MKSMEDERIMQDERGNLRYYATATPTFMPARKFNYIQPEDLYGHEYEGSPGGYLVTREVDNPMEASIFMMGLILEAVNIDKDKKTFDGELVVYESWQNGDVDEYFAFAVKITKHHP